MLSKYLNKGTKIMGLAELVNSGRPAFDGCYRVVPVGASMVVEFFEASKRTDLGSMKKVRILPYRPGMINQVALGGQEAISGEFTGCVMTLYKKQGALTAGHVDTNPDTSQRDAYADLLSANGNEAVAEYDTSGKLTAYPGVDGSTLLFCVATSSAVDHYFVSKSSLGVSKNVKANPMMGTKGGWQIRSEAVYTVL
ncbi:hypothetical protein R3X27_07220 [Tropicimonas sp. TH_r6]|uniref:hypothetical protein n=1 Tax=Tropicimonas sp. TH_r6 TaxID=3082085 RepID=UPI002954672A|nr:hypothetical protein [Tropicimonas sp. TH_r6]MDV7142470.1 hypothetical protein [Tropicimonas sp. TH_r6]